MDPEQLMKSSFLPRPSASPITTADNSSNNPQEKDIEKILNPVDFGAVGDGRSDDTNAIQAAIDATENYEKAVVYLRSGTFRCRTLRLVSDMTLRLDADAVLQGAAAADCYTGPSQRNDPRDAKMGERWFRALLVGEGIKRVVIEGQGAIDGGDVYDPLGEEQLRGPHTVLFQNCHNIRIEDITIRRSSNYAIFLRVCNDALINNVTIEGGWDGVHIRGNEKSPCKAIQIKACRFATGDDAIAGWYWRDTLIEHCEINTSCNGLRLIGPAENLTLRDCRFIGPGRFPHRKQQRHNSLCAILLQPGAWDPTSGSLRHVHLLNNIVENYETAFACWVFEGTHACGLKIENFKARGLTGPASSIESWASQSWQQVSLSNLDCQRDPDAKSVIAPLNESNPPRYGCRPLPATGLMLKNVECSALHEVNFDQQLLHRVDDVATATWAMINTRIA